MAASSGTPAALSRRSFSLSPREVGLAGMVTLLGIALRCGGVSQVALSHFDEGVYASNVWFGPESDYAYPARHLYAPPLVPALIELAISLLGPTGSAPLLPGLISGCLLVPLVWWVGRQWFGPPAGLLAATLAALSGPHAYFSRTALTDAPLCLFLTAAVYLGGEWIQRGGSWRWIAGAGCAALAWWTKYNGWLPLAIWSSAVVPWLLFRRGEQAPGDTRAPVSRETDPHFAGSASRAGQAEAAVGRISGGGDPREEPSPVPQPGWQASRNPPATAIAATATAAVSRETGRDTASGGGVSRETTPPAGGTTPGGGSVSRETGPSTPSPAPAPPRQSPPTAGPTPPPPGGPADQPGAVSRGTASPVPSATATPTTPAVGPPSRAPGGAEPDRVAVPPTAGPAQPPPGGPADQPGAVSRGTEWPTTSATVKAPAPATGPLGQTTGGPGGVGTRTGPVPQLGSTSAGPDGSAGMHSAAGSQVEPARPPARAGSQPAPSSPAPSHLATAPHVSRETHEPPARGDAGPKSGADGVPRETIPQPPGGLPGADDRSAAPAATIRPETDTAPATAAVAGARNTPEPGSRPVPLAPPPRTTSGPVPVSRETSSAPSVGRVVVRVALLLALAGGLWLPCLWGLDAVGGYSVVAANHRRYLVGWSGMAASVLRQYQALSYLDAPLCRAGWLAGLAVLALFGSRPGSRSSRSPRWWVLLAGGALLGGTLPVTTLAALGLLISLGGQRGHARWGELPIWLLAAWWVSLSLATPGYTPYPRLTLPWLVASWLAAGAWVGGWWSTAPEEVAVADDDASRSPLESSGWVGRNPTGANSVGTTWTSRTWVWPIGAGAIWASLLLLTLVLGVRQVSGWQRWIGHPQQGLADGARQVVEAIQQSLAISQKQPVDALVYVHAEPALVYHLRARGLPVVQPVQDLEFTRKPGVDRAPTFVILGDRSHREPGFQRPPAGDPRWRRVADLELAVPPLVWLDEAWQPVAEGGLDRPNHLEVWRVGSAPNP
jgi:hypothetical protein